MEIREVVLPKLPKQSFCLAHVADLHNEVPEGLWEALEAHRPDVVLCTGDVIHSAERYQKGLDFLKECASRFLTCCSLGNHEFKYGSDFRERIRETGAILLDDAYIKTDGLVIGGLTTGFVGVEQGTFRQTPAPKLSWLDEFCEQKGYRILLSHHPEYFDLLKDYDVDLILSGHAHGGQWRFFGLPIFAPGQGLFPKYTSGFYENKMFVSRGMTNTAPVPRIGNKTEIVFFVKN